MFESKLVSVSSAFSGFGVYRMKVVKDISYNERTNNIEHIDFNSQINNLFVYTKFRPIYEGNGFFYFGYRKYILIFLFLLLIIIIILGFIFFYNIFYNTKEKI